MKTLLITLLLSISIFGQSGKFLLLMGDDSWFDYVKKQDANFLVTSRDSLTLIDYYGNDATLIPAVAKCYDGAMDRISLSSPIEFTNGEVIVHAYQPIPQNTGNGIVFHTAGTFSGIQIRTDTQIGVPIQNTWKIFNVDNLSKTSMNVFRLVITTGATTKARLYLNGVESSSGEQDYAAAKVFQLSFIGHTGILSYVSYVKVTSGSTTLLETYPNGLSGYEFDLSPYDRLLTWTGTPSSVYIPGGSSFLMDNGFNVYEKYGGNDVYAPLGGNTLDSVLSLSYYQIKERVDASNNYYNLAPSLIQFSNSFWDRSDTTIWNWKSRSGYYDATSADTKKRWHSSELNQTNFKDWLQDEWKEFVFTKFQNNDYYTGRMLQSITAFNTPKTGDVLTKLLGLSGYKPIVTDLTSQFVVSSISGQLDWTDIGGQYEIWSSINGRDKVYKGITTGAQYVDTTCKQGAWVKYYIRPLNGAFNTATLLSTPLVMQFTATAPDTFNFQNIHLNSGTLTFDWGNSTDTTITSGANKNPKKIYGTSGTYDIAISGDVRKILLFECYNDKSISGDITNWALPDEMTVLHTYNNDFTGDITDHINYITDTLHTYHLGYNPKLTGSIDNWDLSNARNLADIHLENDSLLTGDFVNLINSLPDTLPVGSSHLIFTNTKGLTGDLTNLVIPYGINWFLITGCNFTGDLTAYGQRMPATLISQVINNTTTTTNILTGDVTNWVLPNIAVSGTGFTLSFMDCGLIGDMSGVLIPSYTGSGINLDFSNNQITKAPRGEFNKIVSINFSGNNISQAELDAFFAYVDNYFTGGVVPTINAIYVFSGLSTGAYPSVAGFVSIQNIKNKYTAVGKTATISVNTP